MVSGQTSKARNKRVPPLPHGPAYHYCWYHGVYAVAAAVGDGSDMGRQSPWLSVLNVLSGGVFVAAGFMHLLPEAEEDLRELSEECNFEVRKETRRVHARINIVFACVTLL